jgi:hypothetical protein
MKKNQSDKQKRRWSAVDTVILLLVLVSVAGLVYRIVYAANKDAAAEPVMYRVCFEVLETHEDVLAEVKGFDAVYLYENDVRLGYIGVYEDTATGDYTVALTPSPAPGATGDNRVTAVGCMVCTDATPVNGGIRVGDSGRYLVPGSILEVRTDRALLTIRVTSVRKHS